MYSTMSSRVVNNPPPNHSPYPQPYGVYRHASISGHPVAPQMPYGYAQSMYRLARYPQSGYPQHGYPQHPIPNTPYVYSPRLRSMGPSGPNVPDVSDVEERSNGRYVREMIFEGTFIIFMIVAALATTYFAIYYLGWGDMMEEHNIDYLHQWAAQFPSWMESVAVWVKGVLGMA